jgi:hypothetical protein
MTVSAEPYLFRPLEGKTECRNRQQRRGHAENEEQKDFFARGHENLRH